MSVRESPSAAMTVDIEIEVRFAETDLMQVVHHASYLPWLEQGRIAYMKARGMPYTEISRTHHFSVVDVSLRIRRPLTFGDAVRVSTVLERIGTRKLRFAYALRRVGESAVVATGATEHVCVDLEGRAARIPHGIVTRLRDESQ